MRGEPRLVLGTHDLGATWSGGDLAARDFWMPFAVFRDAVDILTASASGFELELTSDDGFLSDFTTLLPWLVETGRHATFFVPAGFVGRSGRITKQQLREIHAAGMEIGAHGTDHLNWRLCSDTELAHEVAGGKRRLEDMLGVPVRTVAPPYGAYDARVHRVMRDVGFATIYTCDGRFAVPGPGRLRSRVIVQSTTIDRLVALARRGPQLSDRVAGGWRELKMALA